MQEHPSAPGFNVLRQNQLAVQLAAHREGQDFYLRNYEAQRRAESPTYNSAVLNNIAAINQVKARSSSRPENLFVLRDGNTDNGFLRIDETEQPKLPVRALFHQRRRLTNQSP